MSSSAAQSAAVPQLTDVLFVLQVESVQLASESAQKQLEAELAAAKRDAAQAAAAHKSTAASRQSELDWQKAEASRACLSSWLLLLLPSSCAS